MGREWIIASTLLLICGAAHTQTGSVEDDYENIDKLHHKLVRMKKEMDRLMKDVLSAYPAEEGSVLGGFGEDVRVDIVDEAKRVIVKADLPGMDKDKIDITLENDRTLKISAQREVVKSQTAPGVVRQERGVGRFERVLDLPAECSSEGISASYKNGVLELVIPKKRQTKEEKVRITVQ